MMVTKPFQEMNTDELREATREFNQSLIILKSKPLSPAMRVKWEKARRKKPGKPIVAKGMSLSVNADLHTWLTAQAKKRKISRSRFVADLLQEARKRVTA